MIQRCCRDHGPQNVRQIRPTRISQNAPFIRSMGIELTSFGKGWCESRVKLSTSVRPQHGFIHGAALMALVNHTCGGAAASTVPEDREVITVENKLSFLRPAQATILLRKESGFC